MKNTRSLTAGQAARLQVAPRLASLPVFAILTWLLSREGLPNIMALALTILIIEVPVSWFIMVRHVRQESGGRFTFAAAFPWAARIPWWQYLLIGVPVTLFSMAMILGVGLRLESVLIQHAFGWVPAWFVMRPDPAMFTELSRAVLLTLWVLMFLSMVVAGGLTQELYSRGFLLPRTQQLGRWAPAFNALMFAVLHLIAPWAWPVFFIMVLPWAYLVWWRRSVKIGIFIHVGMVGLQWMGMTLLVFGLISPPG